MAHINLLPWREELAKQKKQEFAFSAGGSVVIAALIVLMVHFHVDGLINNQNQRNAFLENEIDLLNERIGRIQQLEAMKDDLLARMNVIQELQSSRPESVHLMDELVRTLPEGAYLKAFSQQGRSLTMVGVAQSNARVSDYMRNIDSSDWFAGPRLDLITATEVNRHRVANFTLRGSQQARKPADQDDSSAEVTP